MGAPLLLALITTYMLQLGTSTAILPKHKTSTPVGSQMEPEEFLGLHRMANQFRVSLEIRVLATSIMLTELETVLALTSIL